MKYLDTIHVAVMNISKYECVIWNHFPKPSHKKYCCGGNLYNIIACKTIGLEIGIHCATYISTVGSYNVCVTIIKYDST